MNLVRSLLLSVDPFLARDHYNQEVNKIKIDQKTGICDGILNYNKNLNYSQRRRFF